MTKPSIARGGLLGAFVGDASGLRWNFWAASRAMKMSKAR